MFRKVVKYSAIESRGQAIAARCAKQTSVVKQQKPNSRPRRIRELIQYRNQGVIQSSLAFQLH